MLIRLLPVIALCTAVQARAQAVVVLRDAGPGRAGTLLASALAHPHATLRGVGGQRVELPRDATYDSTIVVLGSDATVASTVNGDVIVVAGDLFIHPGAHITGRAVAIGGGVYNSTLATIGGGIEAFRDVTYDLAVTAAGTELSYRDLNEVPDDGGFTLPLVYGFRVPEYTRVDGAVIPWGPRFAFDEGRFAAEPEVAYRSDLGAVDPSLRLSARLTRRLALELDAGRTTLSNDRWIQSDPVNTLAVLFAGHDFRNYYRSDRAELRVRASRIRPTYDGSVWVGGRTERDWSVAAGGPWSLTDRGDTTDGMRRPNPPVAAGHISSVLAGAQGTWDAQQLRIDGAVELELPVATAGRARFTQTTLDGGLGFPTFLTQTFELRAHAVFTTGDGAPPQRFAYLGGSGTLPTLGVLELGGDHLLMLEGRYNIPIQHLRLPLVGAPTFVLREMIGSAGVGSLPALVQNMGLRLMLLPLKVDFTIDPVSRSTDWSVGLSLLK